MHKHFMTWGMAGALLLTACGQKEKAATGYSEFEKPDTTSTVQQMKDYHYSAEVKNGTHTYAYDIVREMNDSLPTVRDDEGDQYADNYIRLRVNRDGKEYFNRMFTKQSFRNNLDADFITHAILEGMAFDRVTAEGLRFAVSVSYPASDLYIPLCLTIAPDGSYSVTRDEVLDTVMEADSTQL